MSGPHDTSGPAETRRTPPAPQPARRSEASKEPDFLDIYDRYVASVRHENDLLNHRITWFLAIESLLFAAAGLLFRGSFETIGNFVLNPNPCWTMEIAEVAILWMLCCVAGLLIAVSAKRSIGAAIHAHVSLERRWIDEGYLERAEKIGLPALRGGAHPLPSSPDASAPLRSAEVTANHGSYFSGNLMNLAIGAWSGALFALVIAAAVVAHRSDDAPLCSPQNQNMRAVMTMNRLTPARLDT